MEIYYLPVFVKAYYKLPQSLKEEVRQKIELFRDPKNHVGLSVHKLHGKMKDRFSFSINYRYRIVFKKLSRNIVAFLTIGDHKIYQ